MRVPPIVEFMWIMLMKTQIFTFSIIQHFAENGKKFFADRRKNVHKKYQEKAQYPLDKSAENAIIQKLSDSATEYGGIAQLGARAVSYTPTSSRQYSTMKYRKSEFPT